MIVVLVLSELARGRFQRVIDRQFFREKYKFDRAMQKMNLAVGQPGRPARRSAGGCSRRRPRSCRLEWGALYLADASGKAFQLVAAHGPSPEQTSLAADNPLVARLREAADAAALARDGPRRLERPRLRRHDRARRRSRRRARRRRATRRFAGPGPQAQRHAVRRRGDGVPGGARLGRHAGASFGRHPGDARNPQSRAARQGRQDRRATATDLDPARSAQGSGRTRARTRSHRPTAGRRIRSHAPRGLEDSASGPSRRSRARARPCAR